MNSIFLIDDDLVCIYLYQKILLRMGVKGTVTACYNGLHALDCIQDALQKGNPCPSLILLDMHMHVLDGYEFLEAFYKLDKCITETKVIVVTNGFLLNVQKLMRTRYRIDYYIEKPLTIEKLEEAFINLDLKKQL